MTIDDNELKVGLINTLKTDLESKKPDTRFTRSWASEISVKDLSKEEKETLLLKRALTESRYHLNFALDYCKSIMNSIDKGSQHDLIVHNLCANLAAYSEDDSLSQINSINQSFLHFREILRKIDKELLKTSDKTSK